MDIIDHKQQAQSRIYAEYRDKPKFVDWIGINGGLGNQIEDVYQHIRTSYDIDIADSNELDIIGRIVGIGREFESIIVYDSNQFGRNQFGSAQFTPSLDSSGNVLNDNVYRLLIKAKIARNNSDTSYDSIIETLKLVVETDSIGVIDPEDMSFSVEFGSLTDLEIFVLSNFQVVPKPQGVQLTGFSVGSTVQQFGRSQFGRSQFAYKFGV